MDPRLSIIQSRLKNIKKIIAIGGGKGGIGKSSISSILALELASRYKVGLFDLDFSSPSNHIILGVKNVFPIEEKGIVPPIIHKIKFMSIVYYTANNPMPLRGHDVTNVILELLAVTIWGKLDFLIIDMPPGIGEPTLDLIKFTNAEFLIVTTSSKLALETVEKEIKLLKKIKIPILGYIENMSPIKSVNFDISYLGNISYDKEFENALGRIAELQKTKFAEDIRKIIAHKFFNEKIKSSVIFLPHSKQ